MAGVLGGLPPDSPADVSAAAAAAKLAALAAAIMGWWCNKYEAKFGDPDGGTDPVADEGCGAPGGPSEPKGGPGSEGGKKGKWGLEAAAKEA